MEVDLAERTGPSLAWRLAAAIALTVGFHSLAIVIAAALLALAILPWVLRGSSNVWVTLTCFVLGVTVLVAIFPRRQRYEPHGEIVGGLREDTAAAADWRERAAALGIGDVPLRSHEAAAPRAA